MSVNKLKSQILFLVFDRLPIKLIIDSAVITIFFLWVQLNMISLESVILF